MTFVDNRNTSNPYINLAIEEFLVRNADCTNQALLLLYINEPCIVLGKNQSIYKELNFEYLRNGKLQLCRRISGGGTVYQDKGNISFSFISGFTEQKINNYRFFNEPVIDALRKIGVDAGMDSRNNILCNGKKISGNAQFTNRKNIISHGTLLFDADLDTLRACLKENEFKVESRAVSSVRSSVMNLKGIANGVLTAEDLKNYLRNELGAVKDFSFTDLQWKAVQKLADEKFKTFEWVYGRSPLTTITKQNLVVEVEDGLIKTLTVDSEAPKMDYKSLVGVKYQFDEIKRALEKNSNAPHLSTTIF